MNLDKLTNYLSIILLPSFFFLILTQINIILSYVLCITLLVLFISVKFIRKLNIMLQLVINLIVIPCLILSLNLFFTSQQEVLINFQLLSLYYMSVIIYPFIILLLVTLCEYIETLGEVKKNE